MKRVITAAIAGIAMLAAAGTAGANTFTWAAPSDAPTLDPHGSGLVTASTLYGLVYEPLARLFPGRGVEPALAESWQRVDDRRWRFKLRSGVTFHEGQPFTADDVVFSLDRARGEGSDLREYLREVTEIAKVDDLTVDVVTSGPVPIMPILVSSFPIMSRSWALAHKAEKPAKVMSAGEQGYASFNTNGTGPFKMTVRRVDERTEFVVNEKAWEKPKHNFTKLVFRPIKDPGTRAAALLSGEVDFIDGVPVQDVDRMRKEASFVLSTTPEWRGIFLGLDMAKDSLVGSDIEGKNPFKDIRVRRAFYQAIDANGLQSRIMRGLSEPGGLIIGPGVDGYAEALDKRLPFDPEAAKKLLAEAGYPQGFRIALDCSNDRYVNDSQICLAVVSMLGRIGIKVDLAAQPASLFFPKVFQRKTSFFMFGWGTTIGDAAQTLNALALSNARFNFGGYANPQVDDLIKRINVELDAKTRTGLMQQAVALHKDDIAVIPLHRQVLLWAHKKNVKIVQTPDNILRLALFRFE